MRVADPVHVRSWRAELALGFERRAGRTVLAERRHDGPLVVQKPLYPEGGEVCHAIVVHPPAGMAGGDELDFRARADEGANVVLTTPGAGKWYRSAGPWATQSLAFEAGPGACMEWLPQETILYDGALAELRTEVNLAAGACFIGWEVLCLGRSGAGERYSRGTCKLRTIVKRGGTPLWVEQGRIDGGGSMMGAAAGLGGHTVCGTLYAAAAELGTDLVAACRSVTPVAGAAAVTPLPGVLLARYLGDSSEAAKRYFIELWRVLRPAVAGRAAVLPRIWST